MKEYIVRYEDNKFTIEGEIVRCKDCVHRNWKTKGCKRNPSVEGWLDDDFCNYGIKQVTGKLNNPDDSLVTEDSETSKEQKSKLYIPLNQHTIERINRLHKNDCGDYFDEEWLYNELEQIAERHHPETSTTSKTETVDTDIISRQAAIDALKICDSNEDGINCHKCPLRDTRWDGAWYDEETTCYTKLMRDSAKLIDLPSAHPEKRTETNACDSISRQAAIKAVNTALFPKVNTAKDAENALESLPPVEPKRPKGEWKYGNGNGECPFCGREKQRGWDNFCGFCGADMRGADDE